MKASSDKNTNDSTNTSSSSNLHTSSSNPIRIPGSAWKVLAILSCIATMVMYAETMLIPAIPNLIKDFHVSYSMSSWILTAYLVSGAVMTPIAGKLSDIYGRKKILLVIMAIYAVGVSLSGFAANIYFLLIARAIQGIGMAMFAIAFGIVRDQFPREKISIGQGVITSMFASGAVIGLALGGIIVQNYGWRTTFFTIIPIAVALLLIIRRFIHVNEEEYRQQNLSQERPEKQSSILEDGIVEKNNNINKKSPNQIDIKGAILLATTITSFLLVLTLIETSGGSNNSIDAIDGVSSSSSSSSSYNHNNNSPNSSTNQILLLAFLITGIISIMLFVLVERRVKYPLVDFRLMLNKSILPANLIIMLIGLSMFMVFQTIPILVNNPIPIGFSGDAITAGKVQLPFAIILLIFGPTSGFVISKLGSLKPIIFGAFITAAGFIGLLIFHSTEIAVSTN
ncbi:MAG TPA: MFS transporter, partial [Nitrososphaeraceae archaeon]|nr:MFS transporter [Nitrososphaeraceae archaeon]